MAFWFSSFWGLGMGVSLVWGCRSSGFGFRSFDCRVEESSRVQHLRLLDLKLKIKGLGLRV